MAPAMTNQKKKTLPQTRADEPRLTKTFPAVRVTDEVYAFYERKRQGERRRKISEVVRLALEDYASQNEQAA